MPGRLCPYAGIAGGVQGAAAAGNPVTTAVMYNPAQQIGQRYTILVSKQCHHM